MVLHFGTSPETEQLQHWFEYAMNLCRNADCCEHCILAGRKPYKTDISVLFCETGKNKTYKGNTNE